ncbi:MAG: caspase family protein [Nitrospirae bacterium]|nr:caspase family protein [Nitrospirota bacterium]
MGHYDALIEFAPPVFKIEKDCHSGVFVTTSILTGGIILLMGFASPLISMEAHLDLSATVYDRQGQIILASASYKAKTPVIRTGETGGPEERFLGEAFEKVLAEALKEVTLRVAAAPKLQQYAQALPRPPTAQREPAAPLLAQPSDVDTLPLTTSVPSKHRHAVVIGIEQYRQQLPRADLATQDARIMGEYVTKVMGYAEENVVLLLNERAAKSDLEKYLEKWLPNRVEPGDSVFLYFSGHGAPNPKTGEAYLVPYDGDPGFVDTTGYPLKRLYEHLAKLPAKEVVVLLDSCFSGAGGRSVLAKGMRPMVLSVENPLLASGKTVVLAASAGDQVSSTYIQKGHGLLTYFVLKGLRGEADQNQDGTLELAELFSYVKPQVERIARREFNNEQTPHLLGSPEVLTKGVRLVERARP